MLLHRPFQALTSTVDGDILQILAASHDEFTVPRLASLIPQRSVAGLRLAAERLAEQGIVVVRRVGRASVYSLNDAHVLAGPVRAIAAAKETIYLRLREAVESWEHPPLFAAVFGSAARGEMTTESDIDIFMVCPNDDHDWGITIGDFEDFASSLTGNDARVVELHEDQLFAAEHRPLVDAVVRDGIPFTSDAAWLRRALGSRAAA